MSELRKKITTETLLEKIPAETCWLITAQALTRLSVMRGSKIMPSVLGKEEGVFAPVWGWETWKEILVKVHCENSKRLHLYIKEAFNIPVEDAVGAAKLVWVAVTLQQGPESEREIVEATPERVVGRTTKCGWWERFNELEVDPEFRGACTICEAWGEEGLKAVNPKLTIKRTKARPRGDPYCEFIYEFKEE